MDALLETALDIELAADFDVTDLLFPVRARFISYSQTNTLSSICLAYGKVNVHSPFLRFEPASITFGT